MNDDELEVRLRRYRGSDAPASLRTRVLTPKPPRLVALTVLDWGLVAAALVLVAVSLATSPELSDEVSTPTDAAWEASVEDLAAAIGGGEDAVRYARMVVPRPTLMLPAETTEER